MCWRGPCPAVITTGSRWYSPTLPGTLSPPCAERGWAGSEERPWDAALGLGVAAPLTLSPASLTEATEREDIQGQGGFGFPLPSACAEVAQGGVG